MSCNQHQLVVMPIVVFETSLCNIRDLKVFDGSNRMMTDLRGGENDMRTRVPRLHERRRVLWAIRLQQGDRVAQGEAVDVSAWGAKVRIAERFELNSTVVLTIGRLGSFRGEIRWQDDRYAGIAFAEKANAVEDRLRGHAPAAAGAGSGTGSVLELAEVPTRPQAERRSNG
jgi:hypothetical protein